MNKTDLLLIRLFLLVWSLIMVYGFLFLFDGLLAWTCLLMGLGAFYLFMVSMLHGRAWERRPSRESRTRITVNEAASVYASTVGYREPVYVDLLDKFGNLNMNNGYFEFDASQDAGWCLKHRTGLEKKNVFLLFSQEQLDTYRKAYNEKFIKDWDEGKQRFGGTI